MFKKILSLFLLLISIYSNASTKIESFVKKQELMGFSKDETIAFLKKAKYNQKVIDAITRPWEAKPWYQYRPIFITDKRIRDGIEFWRENNKTIQKASKQYSVEPEIIVAIIGIETFYGNYKGKYSVLDSLYTLAFNYPPREKFFQKELGELQLLLKEDSLELSTLKGSYAGAMGYGQFIPSSVRNFGVDFDNDGKRDLIGSVSDSIGSVANYFNKHGWIPNSDIALKLNVKDNTSLKSWVRDEPLIKVSDILSDNVSLKTKNSIDKTQDAMFIKLENNDNNEYWIGLNNFYVITRYNKSALYAMAVYQLSEELKREYNAK